MEHDWNNRLYGSPSGKLAVLLVMILGLGLLKGVTVRTRAGASPVPVQDVQGRALSTRAPIEHGQAPSGFPMNPGGPSHEPDPGKSP